MNSRRLQRRGLLALILVLMCGVNPCFSAELVLLTYEYATTVDGPWQPVDPANLQVSPTGTVSVQSADGSNVFFRLKVSGGAAVPVVTLEQAPSATLKVARTHLARLLASPDTEFADHLADVDLAPFVTPLASPGSRTPSHYEFKFVRKLRRATKTGFRAFNSSEIGDVGRGYMICSADQSDVPVVEFATAGDTPVESLLKKCGKVTPAKIVRYGAGFWVAENNLGELIANHGTEPFRPPVGLIDLANQAPVIGNGNTETGQHEPPPATKLTPAYYRDYNEFKADWETNGFYKLRRARREENAKVFWNAERGIFPEVLRVVDGQTATFLPAVQVDNVITDVEAGERPVANVSIIPRLGGISVEGVTPGRMGIKVRVNETITHYLIEVRPGIAGDESLDKKSATAAATAPFWKTITEAYAGKWSDQMRWWQLEDSDWCNLVGCGPTALGMMLGWWENVKSVESAFYTAANSFTSISTVDAPQFLDTSSKKARVRAAYALLHEYCDVICDPFSDAGATMPGDLVEGFFDYIYPVSSSIGVSTLLYGKGTPLVGYSYSYAYDWWGDDWDSSGSRVANGIKSGRPGVIGLGVLWHYALAYGYLRQDYTVTIDGTDYYLGLRKRYLKCNEGWGKDSAAWYSAYDVFLGLSTSIFQKKAPTQ